MAGFQIQCTTTAPGESVTMPFITGYTYDCYIDWDDATSPVHVTSWDDPNATHTYAMAGSYTPEITGACPAWSINNTHSSRLQWTAIVYWGDALDFDGWQYLIRGFWGCHNLGSLGSGSILTDGLQYLNNCFRECGQNTPPMSLPTGLFDNMSDVTIMTSTFLDCNFTGSIPTGFFDACVSVTNAARCMEGCGLSGEVPSLLLEPLSQNVYFNSFFEGCGGLKLRPDIFYADGDQGTRFYNQSPVFDDVFNGVGTSLSDNTIPDLWTCDYGSGTPSHASWITGHSASTATNYNFVPVSWGGTAFSPSIKPLTGSYVYDGLDVGQLRDYLSKLRTGSYVYGGLDVGQSRDFISKLLAGSYVYDGLDVGQSRDYLSKLLTGSYVYDGLDINVITPTRGLGPGNYLYSGLALGVTSPYHPMTAIVSWIQGIVGSGIPVIIADQNATVPTGAYLSVRFVTQTITPDKIADRRRSGSVIRYHMESTDILGVDVKAFVASGATLLRQIELGARDPHSRGVPALIDCGPIYGPAFFNDTHYRPMYHCEFRFRVPASLDTVGSRVQTLGLGGDVDSLEPAVEETFE